MFKQQFIGLIFLTFSLENIRKENLYNFFLSRQLFHPGTILNGRAASCSDPVSVQDGGQQCDAARGGN